MRIRIIMHLKGVVYIPFNHQHILTGVIYRLLQSSDADYSRFLHDDGYSAAEEAEEHRRFKLFVFSPLRAQSRSLRANHLVIGPGPVEWLISSPVDEFISNLAVGLLKQGDLPIGYVDLPIQRIEPPPCPDIREEMRFTCLSPIAVSVTDIEEDQPRTRYLRPDDKDFSERVRLNLISKYIALHQGAYPPNDAFEMKFDSAYLERKRGTKMIDFKGVKIIGAYAPFLVRGSKELIETGYECGFGEKNSAGFGMGEVMSVGK